MQEFKGRLAAGGDRKWEEDGIWRELEERQRQGPALVVTGTRTGDQGPPAQPGRRSKTEHQKYKNSEFNLLS